MIDPAIIIEAAALLDRRGDLVAALATVTAHPGVRCSLTINGTPWRELKNLTGADAALMLAPDLARMDARLRALGVALPPDSADG